MSRSRAFLVSLAGLALATFSFGCIPSYEFAASQDGGGTSSEGDATLIQGDGGAPPTGDATFDGTPASEGGTITPIDAPTSFAATPVTVLAASGVATETGNAQQQHLVFATHSQRWWFFYIDADPTSLKTLWSIDFVTWTAGATLTLPMAHGGEGRNFSVAYADLNGHDVIHAATSLHDPPKRIVWDTRATIAGATLTWGTPVLVHDLDVVDNIDGGGLTEAGSQGGSSCDPDGTGVAIGASGEVTVATSWVSVPGCCSCDSNFGTSLQADNGSTWDAGFQAPLSHISVPGTTSARQILSLANGTLLGGWETADNVPPSDVSWDTRTAGAWQDEYDDDPDFWVFPQPEAPSVMQLQEKNDWSFCRIDDNDIHAIHRKYALDGGVSTGQSRVFEHYRFAGSSWTFQGALADDPGVPGSGVVLVTNGKSLMAATVADDGSDAIHYATWNGTTWSAWGTIPGTTADSARKNYLSGSSCADPTHPAILWTEGSQAPYQIIALPVATLIP